MPAILAILLRINVINQLYRKIHSLITLSWDISTRSTVLGSLFITVVLVAIRQVGGLQLLELAAYDQMVGLLASPSPDPRLLIVKVTEDDIKRQKQWPITCQVIAQLLETLQVHEPKVIGLDIYRDVPQPPGHQELLQQLQADNVIVIQGLIEGVSPPPDVSADRVGFNDKVGDIDNTIRRNLMYAQVDSEQFYSFGLRLSLGYLRDRHLNFQVEPDALYIGHTPFPRLKANSGGYQLPDSEARGWQILLKYRSAQNVARQVTLTQVLQGEVDPSWVKGKVVLIGTTALSIKDVHATPYSGQKNQELEDGDRDRENPDSEDPEKEHYLMPGVVIHAQMVSQILGAVLDGDRQFGFLPEKGEWFWIWGWSLLGGVLVWKLNPVGTILATVMGTGGLWLLSFSLFTQLVWMPVIPPALGLIGTSAVVLAYRVRHSRFHDPLTNLPNRYLFAQQLQRATSRPNPHNPLITVLFVDLARVKAINAGLGREAGDYLLIQAAKHLKRQLSSQDRLARVGGDEFGVWLRSVGDLQQANQIANRLQQELTQSFFWKGQEIFAGANVGIAVNSTGQDFQADDLLRYADIALFQAKKSGRPEVFAADMGEQAQGLWQLETDLRQAIPRQEFQLYYQPIISLKTLKIAGFEALVRWQSPQRGFVSPAEFIPLAEETGLILPLGEWILRQACCQIRHWQEQFPSHSPLVLSVNLSNRQFAQPNLAEQIQGILQEVGIRAGSLKLEITESTMIDDVEAAIATLKELKALGLRLSIDDFGTGYSSLSYLHCLPIDTLKVDRSFVAPMDEVGNDNPYIQIVRTIIMLGHNLQLDVVAEGIETELQLKLLQTLNCEYGQGYFFSKPVSEEIATDLLARDPQWSGFL